MAGIVQVARLEERIIGKYLERRLKTDSKWGWGVELEGNSPGGKQHQPDSFSGYDKWRRRDWTRSFSTAVCVRRLTATWGVFGKRDAQNHSPHSSTWIANFQSQFPTPEEHLIKWPIHSNVLGISPSLCGKNNDKDWDAVRGRGKWTTPCQDSALLRYPEAF